ncbi:MAG: SMP-30/gluconolactonase/LRE family protein [Desulfobacterales bacterium]|nr:SMP-30/gluconolactonase/LRE family protein [Desulfobacterales bacterium]MBL7172192.1 SMP-30/gluconolactonase/LRE family protein [Desulfobacteraceae bacterium]
MTDITGDRILIYTSKGQSIGAWGPGDGDLKRPRGTAVDKAGRILVSDTGNHQIKNFSADGDFIAKIGRFGSGDGEFCEPSGIAVSASGNFYVADHGNDRIQKFDSDGRFVTKWGIQGSADSQFQDPTAIAVDKSENVYVADSNNNRIQKFAADGQFITKWGTQGSGDGEFSYPSGVAVDGTGNVYVADRDNNRVQKFTPDGQFVRLLTPGFAQWEFDRPSDVSVDLEGNLYVANSGGQILKFTPDWRFVAQFGEPGSNPGQLSYPKGLSVASDGRVYVGDTGNHRIQVFSKEDSPVSGITKAIIVAGGGPYAGNNIWDATEMCANFAYRVLTYQGYTKDTIYYLSSDTDLDLDGNGKLDDVDADATNANLQSAIQTWAKDADNLFICMIDHGGDGTFRMGATEILQATDLDTWLDALQQNISGTVTVVYDACESGSFLPLLLPPEGKQRVLVTSTASDQESIFVANGTISFSFFFWGHMFNGDSFYDSFVNANGSVGATYSQAPQIDVNGNGIGNEKQDKELAKLIKIGNETKTGGDIPVIGSVSPAQTLTGETSALIYAENVIDANGISRVWAVITPPGYSGGSSDNPVTDLPTMDLISVGNNRYEGTYSNFTTAGTYNIAIFAMDRKGVLSLPVQTTVNVSSSLPACDECTGDPMVLTNVTFASGTACECTAATSITIGTGVTIKSGGNVTFKAPTVKLQSGFHAENGAVVSIKQQ